MTTWYHLVSAPARSCNFTFVGSINNLLSCIKESKVYDSHLVYYSDPIFPILVATSCFRTMEYLWNRHSTALIELYFTIPSLLFTSNLHLSPPPLSTIEFYSNMPPRKEDTVSTLNDDITCLLLLKGLRKTFLAEHIQALILIYGLRGIKVDGADGYLYCWREAYSRVWG